MPAELDPFAEVVDRRPPRPRPAVRLPRLRRHAPAGAEGAARDHPGDADRADRARRTASRRSASSTPTSRGQHAGEPLGERIVVSGRVLGSDGRPLRGQLVEIWQANAAGRYRHARRHATTRRSTRTSRAPGRCLTDDDGWYRFTTVKPGAYPWGNHPNAWRPNHIHFSLFGRAFTDRLVTQMYFPGDPLFEFDPIFNSIRDEKARERLVSRLDLGLTSPTGRSATAATSCSAGARRPRSRSRTMTERLGLTPSQTVGPYLSIGLLAT